MLLLRLQLDHNKPSQVGLWHANVIDSHDSASPPLIYQLGLLRLDLPLAASM